ncbi:MAG: pyruvate kinase [Chloroflexota bacterium]|nr:pyruvate kinase [Chloroflexota bacterium]MDE2959378.1 pyruvate kinase [Chloroflexota bacterium]
MRKTKIIATIGPASRSPEILDRLVGAGMDVARLNFSHGTLEEHAEVIANVRAAANRHNRPVAVLQDLGGNKFRLGNMEEPAQLNFGDEVSIVNEPTSVSPFLLPFPEPEILRSMRPGNLVYISDGTVCLEVLEVTPDLEVKTHVRNGGNLSSYKGVNLPDVPIDMPVITESDKIALQFGVDQDVDWVALSFVRTGEDVRYARAHLNQLGSRAPVMAKLERRECIANLDEILAEVDGIMVARGDLGVEMPMEEVPVIQKDMVTRANRAGRISSVATQMLRSMVNSPTPTRAEVSDIANAVLDGCDSILLSDEIAVGSYPVEAVRIADAAIVQAEKMYHYYSEFPQRDQTQSVTWGATQLAKSLNAKPIVITSTGRAAYEMSRFRPENDIIVFSHDAAVQRRVCMAWGLNPKGVIPAEPDVAKLVTMLVDAAMATGMVSERDVVTLVHGFMTGVTGTTNTIQVLNIQEYLDHIGRNAVASAAPDAV